jgi:hypothetical protein
MVDNSFEVGCTPPQAPPPQPCASGSVCVHVPYVPVVSVYMLDFLSVSLEHSAWLFIPAHLN